jgi:hypothetical protein
MNLEIEKDMNDDDRAPRHPTPMLDNIGAMVSFTFADSSYATIKERRSEVDQLIIDTCKQQGMFYNFNDESKQDYKVHFKLKPMKEQKGCCITLLAHFNSLRKLRLLIEKENNLKFAVGYQAETNFLPPRYLTPEYQDRNLNITTEHLQTILLASLAVKDKLLTNYGFMPHVKFTILQVEGTIDTFHELFKMNRDLQMLVMAYQLVLSESIKYKDKDIKTNPMNNEAINQCHTISIHNTFTKKGKPKHETIGKVYLKASEVLRFEHCLNLQNRNLYRKVWYSVVVKDHESIENILQSAKQYLEKHLSNTLNYYLDTQKICSKIK